MEFHDRNGCREININGECNCPKNRNDTCCGVIEVINDMREVKAIVGPPKFPPPSSGDGSGGGGGGGSSSEGGDGSGSGGDDEDGSGSDGRDWD